jgi:hypothetical protein
MNEAVLYTLTGLGMSFAGFSGLAVTLPIRPGTQTWSPSEVRKLRLLIGDGSLVLFLAFLPVPLALANWSFDVDVGPVQRSFRSSLHWCCSKARADDAA